MSDIENKGPATLPPDEPSEKTDSELFLLVESALRDEYLALYDQTLELLRKTPFYKLNEEQLSVVVNFFIHQIKVALEIGFPLRQQRDIPQFSLILEAGTGFLPAEVITIIKACFPNGMYVGTDLISGYLLEPYREKITGQTDEEKKQQIAERIKNANQDLPRQRDHALILANCFDTPLIEDLKNRLHSGSTTESAAMLLAYDSLGSLTDRVIRNVIPEPGTLGLGLTFKDAEDVVKTKIPTWLTPDSPYVAFIFLDRGFINWRAEGKEIILNDQPYFEVRDAAIKAGWNAIMMPMGLTVIRPPAPPVSTENESS